MRNATIRSTSDPGSFGPLLGQLRSKWRWFVALGVALLILGALALHEAPVTTDDSVEHIGILMVVGAVAQILMAFGIRAWSGFFYWIWSGLVCGCAGAFAFYNPEFVVAALNFLLAACLIVSGALRIWEGADARELGGAGWLVGSGVVSCVAGVLIALGWPPDEQWVLGLWLAIDLTFQGVAILMFGLRFRPAR